MEPNKRKLTDVAIRNAKSRKAAYLIWDAQQPGFAVQVQPSGHKAYKTIYSYRGRPRWYHVAVVGAIGLADARKLAARVMLQVAEGKDPQAERRASRDANSFEELAARHVKEHASKKNKSWRHTYRLVEKNILPRWGKLKVADISRVDVELLAGTMADRPALCQQVLAAASAIFNFGMRKGVVQINPCSQAERPETYARDRVLYESELPRFWEAFGEHGMRGAALKMILLTGQRPGEIEAMRTEHIEKGWWTLPGKPDEKLGWPGTKNEQTHSVWLPKPAQALLAEMYGEGRVFEVTNLDAAMRQICRDLKIENKVTPHDLRRTHGTMITRLGFGRDAMNRIQNHKEGGIADVYDRHTYAVENQKIMESVANHLLRVIAGEKKGVVVPLKRA
jgi:integrase